MERIPDCRRWTFCLGLELKVVVGVTDFDEPPRHLGADAREPRRENVARESDTTVSEKMGHSNLAFTLKCYGRDPSDEQALVADMLERAARAANGG